MPVTKKQSIKGNIAAEDDVATPPARAAHSVVLRGCGCPFAMEPDFTSTSSAGWLPLGFAPPLSGSAASASAAAAAGAAADDLTVIFRYEYLEAHSKAHQARHSLEPCRM